METGETQEIEIAITYARHVLQDLLIEAIRVGSEDRSA